MISSKPNLSGKRNGLLLMLFSTTLLATGCERPLPDTDKNPESSLELPQQETPNSPNHRQLQQNQLQQQLRRSGPRTLVTLHEPAGTVTTMDYSINYSRS